MQFSESVSKAQSGDQKAAVELLDGYRNYLKLLAQMQMSRQLTSKMDPSDVVQETLLGACRDFHLFRGQSEEELAGWLRTILKNRSQKMIRQFKGTQRRDIHREKQLGDAIDQSAASISKLASPISSPSQRVARREASVLLADKLAELPDHYQRALVMHYLEGCTIAEVAEAIGRTRDATNSLLARAMIKLRSLMKDSP